MPPLSARTALNTISAAEPKRDRIARRFENVTSAWRSIAAETPRTGDTADGARRRASVSRWCSLAASASMRSVGMLWTTSGDAPARQRILGTDIGLCAGDAQPKTVKNSHFRGAAGDEMKGMDAPALTDPIDAADSLLEPHRIPWQLEVHDDSAVVVQVQPFTGRIGGEQQTAGPEGGERSSTLIARESTVKESGAGRDKVAHVS